MKKKPAIQGGRRGTISFLALSCFIPAIAYAQTTGWNKADAGPYDYADTANWVGANINGVWDSSLTLTAAQTATFGANTPLATGLNFLYDGAQNVTLRADGTGPYTLTLGGDINVATVSGNRTITLGSSTANQGLNVDLGNAIRTFAVGALTGSNAIRSLTLNNNVTNGGLVLNGGGNVSLNGNTNTLTSLRLQNSALRLNGNGGADVSTTVSGALSIDGAAKSISSNTTQLGGIATVTLTPNANHNTALTAPSLVRANSGVVFFRGNNLGGTLGANNVSNITFTASPDLIGGGGLAGTKNISILNWAVGGTTAAGAANSFVTYDSVNGIRPLNTTTEFETYADTFSGSVTGSDLNTRIPTGTVTFTGNNTVNSLTMGETGVSTLAGDGGTLTVTSGAVYVNRNSSAISQNLNFGTREGIIGFGQPSGVTLSGGIAGSGGLTVYQSSSHTSDFSDGFSATFTAPATFSGAFTVNSRAQVNHSDFLPHGSRTGNTVVNGLLTLNGEGTASRGYTMNGINGNGRLAKGSSGTGTFRIGDNNSNGNFTGIITDSGTTAVQKLGSGTQIFSGANAYNGATQVLGGTLEVTQLANGTFASNIGKSPNTAPNLVINGGTLKYSGVATSTDRLFTVGPFGGGLDSSGAGAISLTNIGNNASAEAANRNGTRVSGSNVVTGVTNFADLAIGARINTGTGIPAGTTITALNPTTGEFTLSAPATADATNGNLTFSTDRSVFLTGSNANDNVISGILANSVNSGKLSVIKQGTGKWILNGANTYGGNTEVQAGTLVLGEINPSNESSEVRLATSSTLNLDFAGVDTVDKLFVNGVQQPLGFYKASGNADEGTVLAQLSGTGRLYVTSSPVSGPGYAAWAAINVGGEAANLDYDDDGTPNGVEFFMNAAPGFTASPGIVGGSVTWINGGNIASSAYDTQFVVETSPDLLIWTKVPSGSLTTNTSGPGGSLTYTLPTGAGKLFVRFAVDPQ